MHPSNRCWPSYRYLWQNAKQSFVFLHTRPPPKAKRPGKPADLSQSLINVCKFFLHHFCVFLTELLLVFSLKIGEDDGILEINRKLAGRVQVFHWTSCWVLSCFSVALPLVHSHSALSGLLRLQVGLNVAQICLSKECSEDEVSQRQRPYFPFRVHTRAVKQVVA